MAGGELATPHRLLYMPPEQMLSEPTLPMLRLRPSRPVGFIEPCQPTTARKPPSGPRWIHEIKHDGYRLMARRDGTSVRLLTRNGNNWSELFPAVAAAVNLPGAPGDTG
jgi:bifunctional non-homologous end joining protein LigD